MPRSASRPIARVLIDSPLPQLDRLFDYAIPDELVEAARPGVRVRVPLRSMGRVVDGFIVELDVEEAAERALSDLEEVVSDAVVMPARLFTLARRVADRAAGSVSDILRLVVPKRQVRVEKAWLAQRAADPGANRETPSLSPDARTRATQALSAFPGLAEALRERQRIVLDAPARPETVADGQSVPAGMVLLAAAAAEVWASGRSSVLVVPDYRDQDALELALAQFVPPTVVVRVDARQSGPERYRAFLRTLDGAPCIVVGNRSAVYAPVDAGLVAVWDDGDALLDEPLAPYVHARDAALVRQELFGHALLFVAHSRSADTERLVGLGYLREIAASRRYAPRVVLSSTIPGERPGTRVPSTAFRAAREALQHGPVLVQVARPGYAPVLVCAECRTAARCTHCSGPLFAASRGAAPVCRWCGRTAHGWRCGNCDSDRVRLASSGSERTADDLGRAFADTRVILADGDHPVERVDSRPALVVATRGAEPRADGGYAAVLLLDGDRMLMADDLRIAESCLRWWSNAAALAAPGAPVHLVGVTGAVARALATWTQPAFARAEVAERLPLRMPPASRVAVIEGDPSAVDDALRVLHEDVPALAPDAVVGPVRVDEDDTPRSRALLRFEYGVGTAVAASLRASVVSAALRGRRGRARAIRATTLRVRLDVADPQL
ncbi:primosomal protein N' [Microbacterium nymphoidis]|uniref:primosomal protein N' family DNA-binding protein n=1 Tax=Microbacterium nymphoidis TaxID=2898586 RepID=UPI001E296F7E|nr:primosomal protein N' [Microbacterium nymphoidis]MCD2497420.1 primosomal protein N' [Microbacterium nymphoidis]